MQSCREYLPILIGACDQLVEYLQQGNPDWIVMFSDFVSGINWLNEVITALQLNHVEQVKNISLPELLALLQECESFLKANDHVSFADCIGFAMKPLFETYLSDLSAVAIT